MKKYLKININIFPEKKKEIVINSIIIELLNDFEQYNNFKVSMKIKKIRNSETDYNFSILEKMLLYSLEISSIDQWLFQDRYNTYERMDSYYNTIIAPDKTVNLIFLTHKMQYLIDNNNFTEINNIIAKIQPNLDTLKEKEESESEKVISKYKVRFYGASIQYYLYSKNYTQALEICNKSIHLSFLMDNSFYIFYSIENLLNFICNTESIEIFKEFESKYYSYYELRNKEDNLSYLVRYIYIIVEIYYWDYKLPKLALNYLNRGLELIKKVDTTSEANITLLSKLNDLKGIIYSDMGKIKEAIQIFRNQIPMDRILLQNFSNAINLSNIYGNIGEMYYDLGDYNNALEYQNEALLLREQMTDSQYIAESYFHLVLTHLQKDNKKQIKMYMGKLKTLLDRWAKTMIPRTNNIRSRYEIALAYVLKEEKNLRDNYQSLELFQKWANEDFRSDLKVRAIIPLIELTIMELKYFFTNKTFERFQEQINNLELLVENFNSIPLQIHVLILKGKIELILGRFESFERFFIQAETLASDYELDIAKSWIQAELLKIQGEMVKWNNYNKDNTPMKIRLEAVDMVNYINDIKKILIEK